MDCKKGFLLPALAFLFLAVLASVPVSAQECGVSVYGLNVEDGKIVGYVRNTGNETDSISYGFYVNGNAVRTGSLELDPDESRGIEHSYSFGHGEYVVEFLAVADCGAADGESIVYNVLEPYMCENPPGFEGQDYCDYTYRRYMVCQDGEWVIEDVNEGEYCYNCNACGDDVCNCGETSQTCWSDCGNTCTPRYLDTYRCNGDWRQRLYRNSDCEYEWMDWYRCEYDCLDGYCVDEYDDYEYDDYYDDDCSPGWKCRDYYHRGYQRSDCTWTSVTYCPDGCHNGYCNGDDYGGCGVSIEGFDYVTQVNEGSPVWVKATVKNTGNSRETITVKIYADNSYWGSEEANLYAGSKATKTFNLYLQAGSHSIRVEAVADCGSKDTEHATVSVRGTTPQPPQTCNYNGVCEYGESYSTCPHDCPRPEPAPSYTTSVSFHPVSLDIESCATGTVSIDITSAKKQNFEITVSGVPEDWVSYPASLELEPGVRRVYLYITPKEPGPNALEVSVKAESEDKEFSGTVEFYVSPEGQAGGSGITGFITASATNLIAVIIVIVAVIAIVLYIGFRRIRPEEGLSPGPGPKAF